jgi:hypothetical protein
MGTGVRYAKNRAGVLSVAFSVVLMYDDRERNTGGVSCDLDPASPR